MEHWCLPPSHRHRPVTPSQPGKKAPKSTFRKIDPCPGIGKTLRPVSVSRLRNGWRPEAGWRGLVWQRGGRRPGNTEVHSMAGGFPLERSGEGSWVRVSLMGNSPSDWVHVVRSSWRQDSGKAKTDYQRQHHTYQPAAGETVQWRGLQKAHKSTSRAEKANKMRFKFLTQAWFQVARLQ